MPGAPGKASLVDGSAVIVETSKSNWGGVISETFELDFARKPMLSIDVRSCDMSLAIQLSIGGSGYYIQGNSGQVGRINIDIVSALKTYHPANKLTSIKKCKLQLIACDKSDNSSVAVGNLEIVYFGK